MPIKVPCFERAQKKAESGVDRRDDLSGVRVWLGNMHFRAKAMKGRISSCEEGGTGVTIHWGGGAGEEEGIIGSTWGSPDAEYVDFSVACMHVYMVV